MTGRRDVDLTALSHLDALAAALDLLEAAHRAPDGAALTAATDVAGGYGPLARQQICGALVWLVVKMPPPRCGRPDAGTVGQWLESLRFYLAWQGGDD